MATRRPATTKTETKLGAKNEATSTSKRKTQRPPESEVEASNHEEGQGEDEPEVVDAVLLGVDGENDGSDDGDGRIAADGVAADDEADDEVVTDEDEPRPSRASLSGDDDSKEAALSRYDPMQAYLREVQRHPLLTPEREHELATRYWQTGDVRSAHTLVASNLRLVVKIAYEYRRAFKNIMDLVQEGNVGLMQAVKKYDPSRGVKLSSYAAWWIRAYILRYILNNWRMVKLGTTQAQRKLFFNLNKEKQKLLAMGVDPTPKLLAERLQVEEREVTDMDVRLGSSEASLDAPVGDSDGRVTNRIDMMPSGGEAADVMLEGAELRSTLIEKLGSFRETLHGKDLDIFDLRLAAQDEPLTLQELGDRFGVSRERVRQLEARIVGKLRNHLKGAIDEGAMAP